MISRSLAVPTLLAASVAVPYVASNAPDWRQQWNSAEAAPAAGGAPPLLSTTTPPVAPPGSATFAAAPAHDPAGPGAVLYPSQPPLEGAGGYSLVEVLRMDVSKEWIYQRWPRKSTALSELDLFGIRVPLVSGTQLYDVAGSLTYYFGHDGRVQRISLRGRTGDTTQLVTLATQRFGLQPQPTITAGEQLYEVRRGSDVLSRLHTRPAPVLWADTPHDSFSVELDLQDPATARPLALDMAPIPKPPPAAEVAASDAAKAGDAKPAEPGWKAFFPRRRVPATQIPNLNHGNMYQ